jgi:hypothetical protein
MSRLGGTPTRLARPGWAANPGWIALAARARCRCNAIAHIDLLISSSQLLVREHQCFRAFDLLSASVITKISSARTLCVQNSKGISQQEEEISRLKQNAAIFYISMDSRTKVRGD